MALTTPQPVHAACLDNEGARALVSRLYGWSVVHIKRLPGYDDLNFYIKTAGASSEKPDDQYILKVINSRESMRSDLMEAHTDVLLHLVDCGVMCPTPVKNLKGEYSSLEDIIDKSGKQPAGLRFMVRMLMYIPGKLVRDLSQPNAPVPDRWYYALGRSLGAINKALLDYRKSSVLALQKQAQDFMWSPNCFPRVRGILFEVKDRDKQRLAQSVLEEFEARVVPKMTDLRQCVLHTDFNDMNIIHLEDDDPSPYGAAWHTAGGRAIPAGQDSQLGALGVIDFSDIVYSNLLFDPSNSQAYMMMSQPWGDPLVSGGHFLAGYNSVLHLTATEMSLVQCCTAARLVQSLVNGLHTYALDPSNEYVLDTQQTGWSVLERLWNKPSGDLINLWNQIADLYNTPKIPHPPLSSSHQQGVVVSVPSLDLVSKKPTLTESDVQKLLQKLYLVDECSIQQVQELIGFENQNFFVSLKAKELGGGLQGNELILKVITMGDSSDRVNFELQVAVLQFLRGKGFCCAEPVANVKGDYLSLEKIIDRGTEHGDNNQQQYGLFLVFLLTYIPGQMISKIGPALAPAQLCFDAGVKLAQMDKLLWDFTDIPDSFKSLSAKTEWSTLEGFSLIRNHLDVVEDEERRQLIESVVETFEREVAPKISTLRKCLIHNDYSDDNIIVIRNLFKNPPSSENNVPHDPQFDITGVIDFTDMTYTCLVFEIANAMAFMLYWPVDDPTSATGVLLAGFQSIIPLTDGEWDLLYVCMMAHLVKDLVFSLYIHRSQPDNEHVMVTQGGWKHVLEQWEDPGARSRVKRVWKDIGDSYRNLGVV